MDELRRVGSERGSYDCSATRSVAVMFIRLRPSSAARTTIHVHHQGKGLQIRIIILPNLGHHCEMGASNAPSCAGRKGDRGMYRDLTPTLPFYLYAPSRRAATPCSSTAYFPDAATGIFCSFGQMWLCASYLYHSQ